MTEVQKVLSGRRISIPDSLAKELDIKVGDIVILQRYSCGILITVAEVVPRKKKEVLKGCGGGHFDGLG